MGFARGAACGLGFHREGIAHPGAAGDVDSSLDRNTRRSSDVACNSMAARAGNITPLNKSKTKKKKMGVEHLKQE